MRTEHDGKRGWQLAIGSLVLVLGVTGCARRLPETARVTGRVTLQGKAVPSGRIVFYPEKGRPAMGTIEADGQYRLTTFAPNDGAILGQHRVTIEAKRLINPNAPKSAEEEFRGGLGPNTPVEIKWLVPEKYAQQETSPLAVEVKRGINQLDFPIE